MSTPTGLPPQDSPGNSPGPYGAPDPYAAPGNNPPSGGYQQPPGGYQQPPGGYVPPPGGYALPPRSKMGAGRIIGIILGSLLALISLAVLAGGGLLTWAHNSRSADGYLTTESERFTTQTAAIASDGVKIDTTGSNWVLDGHLGSVRISATSTTGKPVFIGVGRESDVRAWLNGHAFDRAKNIDFDPFTVSYSRQAGAVDTVAAPTSLNIWSAKASGTGTQTMTWPVQGGNWTIVVANADGTPGVTVEARIGAKLPWLGPLGIGLIIGGVIGLIIATLVIIFAVRGRRQTTGPLPTEY